jgi:hypothetical protein
MAETVRVKNTGLRGVTVADTKVSFIDGEQGILIYRGYRIEKNWRPLPVRSQRPGKYRISSSKA